MNTQLVIARDLAMVAADELRAGRRVLFLAGSLPSAQEWRDEVASIVPAHQIRRIRSASGYHAIDMGECTGWFRTGYPRCDSARGVSVDSVVLTGIDRYAGHLSTALCAVLGSPAPRIVVDPADASLVQAILDRESSRAVV